MSSRIEDFLRPFAEALGLGTDKFRLERPDTTRARTKFDLSALSNAVTRTIFMPDRDVYLDGMGDGTGLGPVADMTASAGLDEDTRTGGGEAAFATTKTIPANTIRAGSHVQIRAMFEVHDADGVSTATFKINYGAIGSALAQLSTTPVLGGGSAAVLIQLDLFVYGVSGTTAVARGYKRTDINNGVSADFEKGLDAVGGFGSQSLPNIDTDIDIVPSVEWDNGDVTLVTRLAFLSVKVDNIS